MDLDEIDRAYQSIMSLRYGTCERKHTKYGIFWSFLILAPELYEREHIA